jgi:bifunctional DNA-binding transcriptional regulator/antitoxin component of YhaV-PrlF toxin-antitoxin module
VRKLQQHGNSYLIPVPLPIRHALRLFKGDYVKLTVEPDQRRLIIEPLSPHTVAPSARPRVAGIVEHEP